MSPRPRKNKYYYFSSRIQNALNQILDYPLAVVEADSGCGKTTAVSECFARKLQEGTAYASYTCFGEPVEKTWGKICEMLEMADPKRAHYLRGLGKPTDDTIAEIAFQISKMQFDGSYIVTLDNYQMVNTDIHDKLVHALSLHNCPNLHIIILTQPFCLGSVVSSSRILKISGDTLTFTREDIRAYFEMAGMPLDVEQAEEVWDTTEGLAAAIHLQLECYRSSRTFETSSKISKLMETALWMRLNQENQTFLMELSVMNRFTLQQAAIISERDRVPGRFIDLLNSSGFIRSSGSPKEYTLLSGFAADPPVRACITGCSKEYTFHALLRAYLTEKFECLPTEEKRMVWHRAGSACAYEKDYANAALFYLKAGELESMGKLPFSSEDRVDLVRLEDGAIVKALIEEPDYKTLEENPELALSLTLELFIRGEYRLHQQYFEWVQRTIFTQNQYDKERLWRLKGEFALMESFRAYNDVESMCRFHETAYELMASPTKLYSLNDAWTFGAPSVVYMFWRDSGRLSEELKQVTRGMPCYYRLSNGNGTGAPKAMEADMLLLAGDTCNSEQLCYEAVCEAETLNQDSICFCAELTLSRIFLLHGNRSALIDSMERLNRRAYEGTEKQCVYMSQISLAFLNMLLESYDKIPAWLFDINAIRRKSLAVTVPFARIINGKLLWYKLKNKKISSSMFERSIIEMIQESKNFHLLLPVVYGLIYLAVSKEDAGKHTEAVKLMAEALSLAVPDQVYLPFAENIYYTRPILETMVLSGISKAGVEQIFKLGLQFGEGVLKYRAESEAETAIVLSKREREIAQLLQQRLSVKEIADKLGVSPSTVRNTMQKIYTKLNIHKRNELMEKKWI